VPRRQWNRAARWVDLLMRQRPRAWCLGQLLSHRGQFGYTAVARCRAVARRVASTHLGEILRGSTHLVGRGGPPLLHATMLGANPSIDKPIRRRCSSQGKPPAANREPRGAIWEQELRIWGFGGRIREGERSQGEKEGIVGDWGVRSATGSSTKPKSPALKKTNQSKKN
jgi:hypothetical protein